MSILSIPLQFLYHSKYPFTTHSHARSHSVPSYTLMYTIFCGSTNFTKRCMLIPSLPFPLPHSKVPHMAYGYICKYIDYKATRAMIKPSALLNFVCTHLIFASNVKPNGQCGTAVLAVRIFDFLGLHHVPSHAHSDHMTAPVSSCYVAPNHVSIGPASSAACFISSC